MAQVRRLLTNFSKGELSPKIEGRPDLAAYFEGARILKNFYIMRQGGVTRRPGTRFVTETKYPDRHTILFRFEVDVNRAYIIEVGDFYMRFFTNKAPILTSAGGPPVEIVTPYSQFNINSLHITNSVDILFLFHPLFRERRLLHLSDTNWVLVDMTHQPPPSFVEDTDISDSTFVGPGVGGGQGGPGVGAPGGGVGPGADPGGGGNGGDGGGSGDGDGSGGDGGDA